MPSSMRSVAAAAAVSHASGSGTGHCDAPDRIAYPDTVKADPFDESGALHDLRDRRRSAVGLSVREADTQAHDKCLSMRRTWFVHDTESGTLPD